jgi:glucose-1-phosphate adenylyltransferase
MRYDKRVVVAVLAGGRGSRLYVLTNHRAKPAVQFSKGRIIDYSLANAMNSKYREIYVAVQYDPRSLSHHIQSVWNAQTGTGECVEVLMPRRRHEHEHSFVGTADAIYQNWEALTERSNPDLIFVLSGDHIYKMYMPDVVSFHEEKDSNFTICATTVPVEEAAGKLGVLEVDKHYRVIGFKEKPDKPAEIPGKPGFCLSSMGNYVIPTDIGERILEDDASDPESVHDFGMNIIPKIVKTHKVFAYPFETNVVPGEVEPSWTDVGTIPSYFDACMDICGPTPKINLHNDEWPIACGAEDFTAPAKNVTRRFIKAGSCIYHGEDLFWYANLGKRITVEEGAALDHCVVFDSVHIGARADIRYTIIDKKVKVPEGTKIGHVREDDEKRGFKVVNYNDRWLTAIPKGYIFS